MNPYTMPLADLKRAMQSAARAPEQSPAERYVEEQWAKFAEQCPDFAGTPEAAEALVRYLPETVGLFPTAEQLRAAHALAWRAGEYQPSQQPIDGNPQSMPMHELKNLVEGLPQRPDGDPAASMPIENLRDQVYGIDRGEPDPAWNMPMGELKAAIQPPTEGEPHDQ